MDESRTYLELMEMPSLRRCWLLQKALECTRLDRALDIARSADAFITGAPADLNVTSDSEQAKIGASVTDAVGASVVRATGASATRNKDERSAVNEINSAPTPTDPAIGSAHDTATTLSHETAPKPEVASNETRLLISPERRQELMARMDKGAKNNELAGDYGLSARQVQGIRMVAARTRGKRPQISMGVPNPPSPANPRLDEVVRYLRQQDDVVVPQGAGEFLLNGRFRVDTTELVSRANRIRSRHGKPGFQLNVQAPAAADAVRPSVGHPVFWKGRVAAQPQS